MAIQEGGKAIGGIIDALKTQPLSLALVVMNLALLALFYYAISVSVETRKHEFELMINNQKDIRGAQQGTQEKQQEQLTKLRDLQDKQQEMRADLRDCEAKINRKVDEQNGGRK
jgi:uncharacterized protein HemX